MPSHFDVHDVVHNHYYDQHLHLDQYQRQQQQQQRKVSLTEGSVSSGGTSLNGMMTPLPLRPALGSRNFSELTQLELGAGYVSKKRDTLSRDPS